MSMDISITLSDTDLEHFVAGIESARAQAEGLDDATIIAAARKALSDRPSEDIPGFILSRLERIGTMIDMVEDVGFGLPDEERNNTLTALAYFANPDDAIPDSVAVLGYLDDAIMIELCVRELRFELDAYEDFHDWRDVEAQRRGEDPAALRTSRAEWAEARRIEAIERMRRHRRKSYVSGSWSPALFKRSF